MDTFNQRLKELRRLKKQRQVDLAIILEMTIRNYQDYEAGKIDPPTSKLTALADYFDVSIDYLVGRTDNPNSHKQ